jgi:hypothetical protein
MCYNIFIIFNGSLEIMIEIISKDQLATLHIGDKFIYRGAEYVAQSEPYEKNGQIGVDVDTDNTFWKMALELGLREKLTNEGLNIAIQGELCGPGIQGNIYNLSKHMFFVFDIFDIDRFEYIVPKLRRDITKAFGLTDAPVLECEATLSGQTCASLLNKADGHSVLGLIGCAREGLVFKANSDRRISFKAVSNKYLENIKD